jgi:hypothetical protein
VIHADAPAHHLQLAAAPDVHTHFSFLFFEVSFPVDEDSGRRPLLDEELNQAMLAGRLAADRDVGGWWLASAPDVLSGTVTWALQPARAGNSACRPPDFLDSPHLLCDTARHERSGVQLI